MAADPFDRHELILIDHAEKIRALQEADRRLNEVDEKLEDDMRNLRQMMQEGFAEGRARDAENSTVLARIEREAFRSVPGNIANQISLHGLIWQVIGVVCLVAVGGFEIYARFHH